MLKPRLVSQFRRPPQTLTISVLSPEEGIFFKKRKKTDKVRSSLSRSAPAGLWKLKSQREEVEIEGGLKESFYNILYFLHCPLGKF